MLIQQLIFQGEFTGRDDCLNQTVKYAKYMYGASWCPGSFVSPGHQ